MSEDIGNVLTTVGWRLITDCPWVVIGAIPFWDKLRVKKSTMKCWIVLVNCIYFFLSVSFYVAGRFSLEKQTFLLNALSPFIFYLMIVIFFLIGFDVHWSKFLYMFLFLYSVSTLINNTSLVINQLIYGMGHRVVFSTTPTFPAMIAAGNFIAFPFLINVMKKKLRPALDTYPTGDILLMCAMPAIFLVMNSMRISSNAINQRDDLYHILSLLLSQVSGIVSIFWGLLLMESGKKRADLQSENLRMAQMVGLQQRGYIQLTESIEKTRAMRHDMRFHLSLISGYMKDKQYDKVTQHLEEYNHSFEEKSMASVCSHYTVDVLAKHFLGQMEELGAETDISLSLPASTGVTDTDLCVVFGNLFENALHGLEEDSGDRHFRARCTTSANSIIVVMDNSCQDIKEQVQKGIGLESVSAIADKYNGVAEFVCRDGEFHASVMLNL